MAGPATRPGSKPKGDPHANFPYQRDKRPLPSGQNAKAGPWMPPDATKKKKPIARPNFAGKWGTEGQFSEPSLPAFPGSQNTLNQAGAAVKAAAAAVKAAAVVVKAAQKPMLGNHGDPNWGLQPGESIFHRRLPWGGYVDGGVTRDTTKSKRTAPKVVARRAVAAVSKRTAPKRQDRTR